MRNYLTLTRFLLKCGLGNTSKKGKGRGRLFTYGIVVVACMPLMGMLFEGGREGYRLFANVGQEQLFMEIICLAAALITFLMSIPMILSVYYMTTDINGLLPLPLTPAEIVAAKGSVSMVYEYISVFIILGPLLAGYGMGAKAGSLYWVLAVLACILSPVLPTIYAGFIAMVIMRLFRGIRNKDLLRGLSFALALILGLSISGFAQLFGQGNYSQIMEMVQKKQSLVGQFGNIFPNYRFLVAALTRESLIQMGLFLVTTAAFIVLFLLVAQKLYLSGVIGMSETSGRRVRLSRSERARLSRQKRPVVSYLEIELKRLVRTPVYFFNCALVCFLMPLFLLIPIGVGMVASGSAVLADIFTGGEFLRGVRSAMGQGKSGLIIILVVLSYTGFIASMNLTSGTSISREGTNIIFMKYIPMSYRDQIKSKLLSGLVLSWLSATLCTILVLVILLVLGMSPLVFLLGVVCNLLTVLLLNDIQMMFDLRFPKLTWENETVAVKQNFHAAIAMLMGMLVVAALVGAGVLLGIVCHVPYMAVILGITVILAAGTGILHKAVYDYGEKALKKLE